MFRRMKQAMGLEKAPVSRISGPPYTPYRSVSTNSFYHLLFCDDFAPFGPKPDQSPASWQQILFAEKPDPEALRSLAEETTQDGRVRYLAYTKLREIGDQVEPKVLLGVIIEVPLSDGLDVLAAYSEGGVRYINQTGKIAVFERVPQLQSLIEELMAVSEQVVRAIGPWTELRKAPPTPPLVRLSFLVSDGLYFGEGPMNVIQKEPLGGPVMECATRLLQAVVPLGLERSQN